MSRLSASPLALFLGSSMFDLFICLNNVCYASITSLSALVYSLLQYDVIAALIYLFTELLIDESSLKTGG